MKCMAPWCKKVVALSAALTAMIGTAIVSAMLPLNIFNVAPLPSLGTWTACTSVGLLVARTVQGYLP